VPRIGVSRNPTNRALTSEPVRGKRRCDHLLTLNGVVGALGARGQRQLGLQSIRLDTIAGTASSRRDFDRRFWPATSRVRFRWEQPALAERRGAAIPPIDVYRVIRLHFVNDGHHRASISAATGQQVIGAYMTDVLITRCAVSVYGVNGALWVLRGQSPGGGHVALADVRNS
jgi:hypothetical protein